MHVHREDTVVILTGKDRGKEGELSAFFQKTKGPWLKKLMW